MKIWLRFIRSLARKFWRGLTGVSQTIEYPYVARRAPLLAGTKLQNNFADCTGCRICENYCPVEAITIHTKEFEGDEPRPRTSKGLAFERKIEQFKVDYASCLVCDECVERCPTRSLGYSSGFLSAVVGESDLTVDLAQQRTSRIVVKRKGPWAKRL